MFVKQLINIQPRTYNSAKRIKKCLRYIFDPVDSILEQIFRVELAKVNINCQWEFRVQPTETFGPLGIRAVSLGTDTSTWTTRMDAIVVWDRTTRFCSDQHDLPIEFWLFYIFGNLCIWRSFVVLYILYLGAWFIYLENRHECVHRNLFN